MAVVGLSLLLGAVGVAAQQPDLQSMLNTFLVNLYAGKVGITTGGTSGVALTTAKVAFGSAGVLGWTATNEAAALDSGISRTAPATLAVGNGTQGDTTGNLTLNGITQLAGSTTNLGARILLNSPAVGQYDIQNNSVSMGAMINVSALPTIASGFGTGPAVTAGSTPFAGSLNVGTVTPGTGGVVNFNGTAFPSAPFCMCQDDTTLLAIRCTTTTTQLTVIATALTASDIVTWMCVSSK
jgi:hypothetical protein